MARTRCSELLAAAVLALLATVARADTPTPSITSTPTATATPACNTVVPAGLVVSQTWTNSGSPYCVEGDIQVSLLTIEPGVQVLVDGPYEIDVLSTITAVGTAAAPILFTARTPQTPWHGFSFQNTPAGSQFAFCTFEYSNSRAISFQDTASIQITHSLFQNNSADDAPTSRGGTFVGGAVWIQNGEVSITDSLLFGNHVNNRSCGGSNCVSSAQGGALFVDGSANVSIQRTAFMENEANANESSATCGATLQAYGSAVYVNSGTVGLTNSLLACNTASATAVFSNCNNQLVGGLALYVAGGTTTLEGTTIARNGSGVAVDFTGGTLQINDSILYFDNGNNGEIGGAPTVTYSDVEGGFTGTGNINYNPVFAGTGCTAADLTIVAGSPAIDAGNPDPLYNDACFPPSLGTARNDMGADGGPGACGWVQPSGTPIVVNGSCMEPGSQVLVPCTAGTEVTAYECRDSTCAASTLITLDVTQSDANGQFSFILDGGQVAGKRIVFDATIVQAGGALTTRGNAASNTPVDYQIVDFGPVSAQPSLTPMIDPSSAAAKQLLEQQGLQNFTDTGIQKVTAAVQAANQDVTFAGLSADSAVQLATQTASSAPAVQQAIQTARTCDLGDCNQDLQVTVDELLTMVNIALGNADIGICTAGDGNGDGQITIDEILTAVNNALNGCPATVSDTTGVRVA